MPGKGSVTHMARKRKPLNGRRALPLRQPKILLQFTDFHLLDQFFRMLDAGDVLVEGGEIVMRNTDGEWFQLLPAVTAWMDYWKALAVKQGLEYDEAPMRSLMAKLDADMPVTNGQIAAAKEVVETQRRIFMAVDHNIVSSVARTEMIRIQYQDQGVI